MSERKVYVVGNQNGYVNWLECERVSRMEDSTIVFLTGGEDCDPALYNRKAHPTTSFNRHRDDAEIIEFKKAKALKKAIVSVCRGAQFTTIMHNGLLRQHVSHPYLHRIKTSTGHTMVANSSHHQQMFPFNLAPDKYELLAWAVDNDGGEQLSPFSYGESYEDDMSGEKEPEIVFYRGDDLGGGIYAPGTLSFQPHPEWLFPAREDSEKEFVEYCQNLIKEYLE